MKLREMELRKTKDSGAKNSILFRGQASACWSLDTTLERNGRKDMWFSDYYRVISKILPQVETFTQRKWDIPPYTKIGEMTRNSETFGEDLGAGRLPAYLYMAYLRHHGFPSPLLDWTRSPYIAALFAFRKPAKDYVAIYSYLERPYGWKGWRNGEPCIYLQGPYASVHRRHFLQQSVYSFCLKDVEQDWRYAPHESVFERNNPNQDHLNKFILPSSEREKVLTQLNAYNLNAYSLFESEEALMETLSFRELESSLKPVL